MDTKRFTKNDSGFLCIHCGKEVPPLVYSSRNHCPYCLWSKHIDVFPGDRACDCGGAMEPYAVRTSAKKGFVITHRCTSCGEQKNNRAAQDDNTELLIRLTNPYNREKG